MGFLEKYLPRYQRTMNLALVSIMTALVFISTYLFQIPIPLTGGYFNLGDAIIYISAILFGPIIGGITGGVGAALADIVGGYVIYAPGTLIIKFCEGFIVGLIVFAIRMKKWVRWKEYITIIIAVIIGGLEMVVGYWVYESYILPFLVIGFTIVALAEVPVNLIQVLIGAIIAIPASLTIRTYLDLEKSI